MFLFSQVQPGSDLLRQGIDVAQKTSASWDSLWDEAINPSNGLWGGLVELALFIAGLSIVIMAVQIATNFQNNASWSALIESFIWPLIIIFFLGGRGTFLADSVLAVRAIGQQQVTEVLESQLGSVTFKDALMQVRDNNMAANRVHEIYGACRNLAEPEFSECIQDPNKQSEARSELNQIQGGGSDLDPANKLLDKITRLVPGAGAVSTAKDVVEAGGIKEFMQSEIMDLIMTLLWALQTAFINILEASLLLTGVFAPIAMGLSILPLAGKPILAWFSGFISLIGVQLGYNIIIGIGATVMVEADAELASDLSFLLFLSIFSPILSVLIAGMGGTALFQSMSRNSAAMASKVGGTVSSLVLLPVKYFA